jgi:hypothetical protein
MSGNREVASTGHGSDSQPDSTRFYGYPGGSEHNDVRTRDDEETLSGHRTAGLGDWCNCDECTRRQPPTDCESATPSPDSPEAP